MILEECNQSHDWPEDGRSNADKGHFARHQKSARKTGKMKNCCKSFLKSAKNTVNQEEKSKIQLQKMKTIQGYEFGA